MAAFETLPDQNVRDHAQAFAPLSARRLLVLTGLGMILAGMIFGDIFAVFILHQNAARVGGSLSIAAGAALAGDAAAVETAFRDVGKFLENRGTKVDTHVHLIGFGYLALMLALVQPWILLTEPAKRRLAWLFIGGAVLLPVCVFLIHYVGLAYSPLSSIGWASIFADAGGALVMLASAGFLFGLANRLSDSHRSIVRDALLTERSKTGKRLFGGGLLLVLIGFAHGALYAAMDLYKHEAADHQILSSMARGAAAQDSSEMNRALQNYGQLQGDKSVNIAAHAHFAEFGILAMLLGFFQPYVSLHERWKRRWAGVLLLGSALLPACVLLELKFGLLAGGFADLGGLLVIIAGFAFWFGITRYTGSLDASSSGAQS